MEKEEKTKTEEKKIKVKEQPKIEEVSSKKEAVFDFGIDLNAMLEAGVYFGHKTTKTHPKMRPYIYGMRNTVHIIDLQKSAEKLEEALGLLKNLAENKGVVLFVGTTPPAKELVKETAESLKMPYVIERWLGGALTNFPVISKRLGYFRDLEKNRKSGELEKYTKKEQHNFNIELQKLEQKMGGIKNMEKLPDLVFIVDLRKDSLAAKEAGMKGIPSMAFCDTNVDPTTVDYPIPANDDAISSIRYILGKVKEVLQ